MGLDITLTQLQPVAIFDNNITHNLGKMAAQVNVVWEGRALTLYDILWHADEHGFIVAHEIAEFLDVGWNVLLSDPEKFRQFNPSNGWGNYHNLCDFVYQYRNACWDNPDAAIRISR